MAKDEVFKIENAHIDDFTFNADVVRVFDDMVNRSVPFYEEIQRMIAELAAEYALKETKVYDLGCSTGTTLHVMDQCVPGDVTFVGIDDSQDMLDKCKQKIKLSNSNRQFEYLEADLHKSLQIENASVVVMCLTLQFVRPLKRHNLVQQVYNGLLPGGVLILVEKVISEDSAFNRNFIKYYHSMKMRNHYSEMEIAQKREALENVLIPYKLSENITLLRDAGFQTCEVFFKWYNFTGLIAKK